MKFEISRVYVSHLIAWGRQKRLCAMRMMVISFSKIGFGNPGSRRSRILIESALKSEKFKQIDFFYLASTNTVEDWGFGHETGRINEHPIHQVFSAPLKVCVILNFLYFFIRVVLSGRNHKLIVATSGRLGTALLGRCLALITGAKLYLDIRENFPRNASEIFFSHLYTPLMWIENFTLRGASHINLISEGFSGHYKHRFPDKTITYITHASSGSTEKTKGRRRTTKRRKTVIYAGTAGHGQNLEEIIPFLASKTIDSHEFHMYLTGTKVDLLKHIAETNGLSNIFFKDTLPPISLLEKYQEADCLFLHLSDKNFAKSVIPSKIFDYASSDKPILAGCSGFPAEFLKVNIPGCFLFKPNDFEDAWHQLKLCEDRLFNRENFHREFCHTKIAKELTTHFHRCAFG